MVKSGSVVMGCALLAATMLLGGCSRLIVGAASPAGPGDEERPPIPVGDLLIDPERFPVRYPAVVLDGTAMDRVLQDIDGVPGGSVVTPPACAPPPLARHHTAAVQGTDSEDASALIVAVTSPAPPLRARIEQLSACPSFTAVRNGETFSVTTTMLAAPPVDADDSYAVDQTVASPSGSTRRTLTLAAQVGQVLVRATWLDDGITDTAPDTQSLDALFTDAVLMVHRVGGR
jgi:hypothetical protein